MGSLLRLIRLSGVVLGCGGIPHVRFLYYHLIGRVIRKSPALSKPKFPSFLSKLSLQSPQNLLAFLQDVLFLNSLISFSQSKPWHHPDVSCVVPWSEFCIISCHVTHPLYIPVNVLRYQRYQTWHMRSTYILCTTPFRFHLEEKN